MSDLLIAVHKNVISVDIVDKHFKKIGHHYEPSVYMV